MYPEYTSDCDTNNVSYNTHLKPVITAHCISCHSNTSAANLGAGIRLETYDDVRVTALNGSLYGTVSADPDYYVMPRDYRVPLCSVLKIKAWIANGASDN